MIVLRVRCRGSEIARAEHLRGEVDFASSKTAPCVSAAETEETKKMDFPSPPHTPFAGPNQGAKRPHTHKLKVALGYSHDNKPIQAKKPIFQKICFEAGFD